MIPGTIALKTPSGQAELAHRRSGLSQRHRTMLFLVDGKRVASDVISMALQAGVPPSCFDDLIALGLIALAEPAMSTPVPRPVRSTPDLQLPEPPEEAPVPVADSMLPASRTLYPESTSTDATLRELHRRDVWMPLEREDAVDLDTEFEEARQIMLRAVRAEAPLAGSLTLLRLRRARSRADLLDLLDEVHMRITKPHRLLAANQTMRRVRLLLDERVDSSTTPA